MDKTEQYIKMCEKAEEIQDIWRGIRNKYDTHEGSYWFLKGESEDESRIRCVDYEYPFPCFDERLIIWLPRQDQLQGMCILDDKGRPCHQFLFEFFYKFAYKNWCNFASMEQLWLAFVIKEKYGKVWDGKQWTK